MDVYKKGEGVIKKFPPVENIFEAEQALKKYCEDNNLQVVAKEKCGDSYWNYLSDGTEFDYTIE
jgi:hypothetical protein